LIAEGFTVGDVADYTVQPKPIDVEGAISSHDLVIQDLLEAAPMNPECVMLADDFKKRKEYGLRKYGVVLHPDNGRDHVKDAFDEVVDLLVYLRTLMVADDEEMFDVFVEDYRAAVQIALKLRIKMTVRSSNG
jgi:hypothetical protein